MSVLLAVAGLALVPAQAGASTPAPRDGSSSTLAAPSCFAIKQLNPASTDGVYWLQTPTLIAPQQFYCDQTTDGGGWVLVGRGRNGWSWSVKGQGTAGAVRNTPTGTGAFAPAALPAATITGLLDGGRVDALSDGIRLRRATDIAGSTWQEDRITPSNRATWSWSVGGGIQFSQFSFDGVNKGASTTASFNPDSAYLALNSSTTLAHNYNMGFGYGSTVGGSNASTSYLWTYSTEKYALPFTQVWLRPKLTSSSFSSIPAGGLPASTVRAMVSDTTSPNTPWGVTGVHGTGENHTEVEALAQIGNVMYVGGDFAYVQKGATPAASDKISQPYLAGFDITTGQWVSSFRPTVNGVVWDLQALPNGMLAVGGSFTTIDGKATALTVLNPTTGAIASGWSNLVVSTSAGSTIGAAVVRALDVQGSWLYLGGNFNRVAGGTPTYGPVTVGRAARVNVSDGRPDGSWKPNFDGSILELDASAQGDRVYFTGYFKNVNATASANEVAVTTNTPATLVTGQTPWVPSTGSGTSTYQMAIKDAGNGTVWQGGSQHILSQYSRSNYARLQSYITKSGGDFQTIAVVNGVVYASCHCDNYVYSGTYNYSNPGGTASDVHNINLIGAWDATTGALISTFYPSALDGRVAIGGWELQPDTKGCLWFGGDFTRGSYVNGAYQWLGGFGKFCANDSTAPTVPQSLTSSSSKAGTTLKWAASTDTGTVSYEVLREDRVIGTTSSLSFVDPSATYPAKYWVRAIDAAGNRSATSASVTEQGPDVTAPSAVTGLSATVLSPTSAKLDWSAATDNVGVTGYVVTRDGAVVAAANAGTSFTDTALSGSTTYSFQVQAVDAAGNVGPAGDAVSVTTPAADPPLLSDSWSGGDSPSWASAWSTGNANGSVVTKDGAGVLQFDDVSGSYARAQLTGVDATADSTVLTSYQWSSNTAAAYLDVYLRGSGGWQNSYRPVNGYGIQLTPTSATVTVQKNVNGTTTNVRSVPAAQAVSTSKQWLRLRVSGTTIQFRTWVDGQREPSSWSSVDTDSSVAGAGQLFISMSRAGSDVGAKSVTLDDLQLLPS